LFVARELASQIWGASWYDPLTLSSVVIVLIVVGVTASYYLRFERCVWIRRFPSLRIARLT